MCGVQPALLVREKNLQLLMYSPVMRMSCSNHYLIFKSQKRSLEGQKFYYNYLIDYTMISSYLPHNHRKVNCYWGCNKYKI